MTDAVAALLMEFDGTAAACDTIVEAARRASAHLPPDDPLRDRLSIFTGNVQVCGFAIQLGSDAEPFRGLLLKDWKQLATALDRGFWLN